MSPSKESTQQSDANVIAVQDISNDSDVTADPLLAIANVAYQEDLQSVSFRCFISNVPRIYSAHFQSKMTQDPIPLGLV